MMGLFQDAASTRLQLIIIFHKMKEGTYKSSLKSGLNFGLGESRSIQNLYLERQHNPTSKLNDPWPWAHKGSGLTKSNTKNNHSGNSKLMKNFVRGHIEQHFLSCWLYVFVFP